MLRVVDHVHSLGIYMDFSGFVERFVRFSLKQALILGWSPINDKYALKKKSMEIK